MCGIHMGSVPMTYVLDGLAEKTRTNPYIYIYMVVLIIRTLDQITHCIII
jgi:hypothetical protein